MKHFSEKRVYLVPFDRMKGYLDSYIEEFGDRLKVIETRNAILTLPWMSTVIIEDVHKLSECYFVRIDLRLIHVPRGGCTLKIGWRTDHRTKWYTWLRLWRRNSIVLSSEFFYDFFRYEERLGPHQTLHCACEPLVDFWKKRLSDKPLAVKSKRVLVALGDRATLDQYVQIKNALPRGTEVFQSIHPRVDINATSDPYNWDMIDTVIVDKSVSFVTFLSLTGIPFIVLTGFNSSREMAFQESDLFENTSQLEELNSRLELGIYSRFKIELTRNKLKDIL